MNDPPIAPGQAEWETRFACFKVVLAPEYGTYVDILRAEHHARAWGRLVEPKYGPDEDSIADGDTLDIKAIIARDSWDAVAEKLANSVIEEG
jgi:hypothetical protein